MVWLLSRSTDLVVRLLGGDPGLQRQEVTEARSSATWSARRPRSPAAAAIIEGAFEIADRTLRRGLRPRPDVLVLDAGCAVRRGSRPLSSSRPFEGPGGAERNLDDVVGLVHLRDLLDHDDRPSTIWPAPLVAFPESAKVLDVLHEMQRTPAAARHRHRRARREPTGS